MSLKAKLTSTVIAMVLVLTMLIVGVLSAKTVTNNVGGRIEFTTTGVEATISRGQINGADVEGKMTGISITNKTTQTELTTALDTWKELNIQVTENDVSSSPKDVSAEGRAWTLNYIATISFDITNNSTDKSLEIAVNTTKRVDGSTKDADVNADNITIGTNFKSTGEEADVTIDTTRKVATIVAGKQAHVTINFTVSDKEVSSILEDFRVQFVLSHVEPTPAG